jgi:hypothetical protein
MMPLPRGLHTPVLAFKSDCEAAATKAASLAKKKGEGTGGSEFDMEVRAWPEIIESTFEGVKYRFTT